MNKVYVTTKKELNALYNESALTFEGMDIGDKNLSDILGWLKANDAITIEEPVFHITKGELMNKVYRLTGNNRYPDDLNILSITNINQAKIAISRFQVGGRWFDDIVDNNRMREEEKTKRINKKL